MVKIPKLLIAAFLAPILGSAGLLAYAVTDGMKPIDRAKVASLNEHDLPPLPKVGLPGAVAPEEELLPVSAQTAQEINASRPFVTTKNVRAAPFSHAMADADVERAVACLATAALYEAGGNLSDQSAVIQVVLNRVRHPAFPKTICGVVFQGSDRRTGCQFSFTCDGSMQRWRPSPNSWNGATGLARAMLNGHVDERVGLATHYHTNWVVPYWSASLDKVTSVRTHLFFRWRGYWGTRAAFVKRAAGREPAIPQLAAMFPSHAPQLAGELEASEAETDSPSVLAEGMPPQIGVTPSEPKRSSIVVRKLGLPAQAGAARWSVNALSVCSDLPVCKVVGWSDPAAEPSEITRTTVSASPPDLVFVKVSRNRQQQAYWDCSKWPRVSGSQCLGSPEEVAKLIYAD